MKNIRFFFLSENFQFLVVKFSVYLDRRVFVIGTFSWCRLYVLHCDVSENPMRTEHLFSSFRVASELRVRFCANKTGLSTPSLPLVFRLTIPRRFLCGSSSLFVTSVDSYMAFMSLFVPFLSFFWCLGKAVLRDCGVSSVSSHIYFFKLQNSENVHTPNNVDP